jgi:hypothetical protein
MLLSPEIPVDSDQRKVCKAFMLLSPEIRETLLKFVDSKQSMRNVLSTCKELRPKQKKHPNPSHKEQARMIGECYMRVQFDNPFVLQLYRVWKAPHTHDALVHWVLKQMISIDEGGLYAGVPYRCALYNAEGVRCLRMRVQLWDRVNRCKSVSLGYGNSRKAWRLNKLARARAYMPVEEEE